MVLILIFVYLGLQKFLFDCKNWHNDSTNSLWGKHRLQAEFSLLTVYSSVKRIKIIIVYGHKKSERASKLLSPVLK